MTEATTTPVGTARDAASAEVEAAVAELFRNGRTWSKQLAEQFRPELPPLAFAILRYASVHGPLRSSDIVHVFGMDKGAVSRQIAILRERGLLDAASDPDDRRSSVLSVSPAAIAAFETFTAQIRAQYARVLDDWSVDELQQLAGMLTRLNAALDEGFQPPR